MRRPEDNKAYLEGQQQIFIAAKVNRLCAVTSAGVFDRSTMVSDAQDIVNTLNPRLSFTRPRGMNFSRWMGGGRKTFVAATEFGNVSASFIEDEKRQVQTEEYRIGLYVGRKYKENRGKSSLITFEHYLARSGSSSAFRDFPHATTIKYEVESLDLEIIYTRLLTHGKIYTLVYMYTRPGELLWQSDAEYKQQRALARYQKRYTQTHGQ